MAAEALVSKTGCPACSNLAITPSPGWLLRLCDRHYHQAMELYTLLLRGDREEQRTGDEPV